MRPALVKMRQSVREKAAWLKQGVQEKAAWLKQAAPVTARASLSALRAHFATLRLVAFACFLGALVTVLGLSSGVELAVVMGVLTLLALALRLLFAGLQGERWAITLSLMVIACTIDATLRRRADVAASGMDAQTLAKLVIWGGALLMGMMHWSAMLRALKKSPALCFMLAFAVWSLCSTIWSLTPTYTFGGGFGLVALILFVAVTVEKIGLEELTLPLIWACGTLTASALLLYAVAPGMAVAMLENGATPRLAGLTGSPNNLGRIAALALFFIFFAVRNKQVKPFRFDIALICICSLACLYLSWSRTALVAVVLSIGVVLLRKRLLLLLSGLAVGASGLLLLLLANMDWDRLLRMFTRQGSLQELTTLTGRTAIWDFVWNSFLREPLLGYGYGSTKLLIPLGFRTVYGWTTTSAHNMFLQALVTTGIVGAFFIAAALLLQLRDFVKRPHDMADALLIFVLISGFSEAGAVGVAPNLLTILWLMALALPRGAGVPATRSTAAASAASLNAPPPLAGVGQGVGVAATFGAARNFTHPPTPSRQGRGNLALGFGRGNTRLHLLAIALPAALVLALSAAPAAAAVKGELKGELVRYASDGNRTTAYFDLARIFASGPAVDGKFGWHNVTVSTDSGRTVARVRYPKGSYNPGAMARMGRAAGGAGFRLKLGLPHSDTVRLSYYLRFAPDFRFVKGGKLPGLGGGKGNTGGRIPDGSDGFSSRLMWREGAEGEVYAYLPDSRSWGTSLGRGSWRFTPGAWHHMEQTLRINTPGKADGEITVRQDGKQVYRSGGLKFRETPNLRPDLLIFETFFGGDSADWATPVDTYAEFADLTASTGN